jgi:hypothetical protein
LAARCSALVALALVAGPALAAPRAFESPEAAADAVVSALEAADRDALVEIFGPEGEDVILTGDDEEDRAAWGQFLRDYRTLNRIDVEDEAVATLSVGRDLWPFPVPLVAGETGWSFDVEAAREEIRLRRIGENELDVIDLMREYVRVQDVYRRMDPDGDGLPTFAAGILSNEGTRDGLYWAPEPDAPESPIGDFMARASADGYAVEGTDAEPDPYLGYYFRVLQRQGPSAPGGAMDYMINGRMVAGHALLAFPAAYGETGVMSFMVGEAGVVYEADLGEATLDTASEIDAFDPGPDWSPVAEG